MIDTDGQIRRLTAGHRATYRVTGVPGLRLDVRDGVLSWTYRYRPKVRRVQRSMVLGHYPEMGLGAARREAETLRSRVILGGDPLAERDAERNRLAEEARIAERGATVGMIVRRMLGWSDVPIDAAPLVLEQSTRTNWEIIARTEILPEFESRPPQSISRREIREWGGKIAKRAPYQANRSFEVLRRAYSWAIENDILQATPFFALKPPFGRERISGRVLTTDELRWVLRGVAALPGPYADAFLLLLYTGVRREMVVEAEVGEFDATEDPQRARWAIPAEKTKADEPHVVPLSAHALEVVRRRLELAEQGRLFPPAGTWSRSGETMWWSSKWVAQLRAKVEDLRAEAAAKDGRAKPTAIPRWTIHNLRHTIGTHMREDLDIDVDVVSLILLHARPGARTTRIYDRSQLLRERRAALDAWGAWVAALLA